PWSLVSAWQRACLAVPTWSVGPSSFPLWDVNRCSSRLLAWLATSIWNASRTAMHRCSTFRFSATMTDSRLIPGLSQRLPWMRGFGIRRALGAAPTRVGNLVLGDGLKLVGIGTVAGLVAALGTTRFLRALLYGVQPTSFTEFGGATVLLVAVTVCATLLPARR